MLSMAMGMLWRREHERVSMRCIWLVWVLPNEEGGENESLFIEV